MKTEATKTFTVGTFASYPCVWCISDVTDGKIVVLRGLTKARARKLVAALNKTIDESCG